LPENEWYRGILIPVTTPFDPVTGDIAPISFRENLRGWLARPVDGIVLFGSTGEGALLDLEEKLKLLEFARDLLPPRLPLIAGVSAESTRSAIAQATLLGRAGADALLVHPPAYFGAVLTPAALREHFLALADASPVPVIVYHVPKYTHVVLEPGLIRELARHPNIVAVKDSSGDLKRLADYTLACGDACKVLVGNGALLYSALELGAAGGVVALGLLATEGCARIYSLYRAGRSREAGEVQERLAPAHREIVARFGPAGVKAALDLLGYTGGPTRPPLRNLNDKERRHLAHVLQRAGVE